MTVWIMRDDGVRVVRGQLTDAPARIERALAEGAPLARYDGRLARAELAAAKGDSDARRIAAEALTLARHARHMITVSRLTEFAGSADV